MPNKLVLLIPGLFGHDHRLTSPGVIDGLNVQALELLLSRATIGAGHAASYEKALFELFRIHLDDDVDMPVAPVSALIDLGVDLNSETTTGRGGADYWLRADPVHLHPDRDNLVMMGNDMFSIGEDEVSQLTSEINNHFSDESWRLMAPANKRWYIGLPKAPELRTHALPDTLTRPVLGLMPFGKDERQWRTIINEVQMLLHASDVNRAREARGELSINSVWLWGGGYLPEVPQTSWSTVFADDVLAQGLAKLAGVLYKEVPMTFNGLKDNIDSPGEALVVLGQGRINQHSADVEGWREWINGLNRDWFEPVVEALRAGRLDCVEVISADGVAYTLTPRLLRRWWKRRQGYATFVGT